MSASFGFWNYLVDYRNSISLVRNNMQDCGWGSTFRGAHSRVEMPLHHPKIAWCGIEARRDKGRGAGMAKPGPTTDTSSRIARIKKLQTRTRSTHVSEQSNGGTQRGAHSSVQNSTSGVAEGSARAQLFGNQGSIPGSIAGRGGDSSQVIYFKKVFERVDLTQPRNNPGSNPDVNYANIN